MHRLFERAPGFTTVLCTNAFDAVLLDTFECVGYTNGSEELSY